MLVQSQLFHTRRTLAPCIVFFERFLAVDDAKFDALKNVVAKRHCARGLSRRKA